MENLSIKVVVKLEASVGLTDSLGMRDGACHMSHVTEDGKLPDGHHCEVDVAQPHLQ